MDQIEPKQIMGLRGILKRYRREFFIDLIWPSIIAICLLVFAYNFDIYSPIVLKESINVGLTVVPVLLSILVAGYVLLLTIYFSGHIEIFKKEKKGKDLLYRISANYAFCIINSILAMVIIIIMSFFFQLELVSMYHVYINYICAFVIYVFLFFTLKNLKDLVLSLFNFGQSFIYEQDLKKEDIEAKDEKLRRD